MEFRPDRLRGAGPGTVDYRLARQALIAEYRRGRLAQHEVCDAHPELRRAARAVARATQETCPICEDDQLVLVSYVFGPKLPASGRCLTALDELRRYTKQAGPFHCYVVEVCPSCHWNHLARSFALGKKAPA